eukprot:CAMPEP_0170556792 /NCGR_PEP_ID=MMETSP0211-20121228/18683_1 /TAXON_ID=311385 /ORGANISM="Pseudokeronopsis sp., Strain OXSARD2" /LENGTH=79 /DNA_ID=CAMNT_0010867343 /DNA_START=90 /DNA_END=329 /DNA_ORIENTATION=+
MQGWRNTQEDSHVCEANLPNGEAVFGVFDGHGGKEVALYIKDRFVAELKKLPSYQNKDYPNALKEVFIKMDDLLKSPQG